MFSDFVILKVLVIMSGFYYRLVNVPNRDQQPRFPCVSDCHFVGLVVRVIVFAHVPNGDRPRFPVLSLSFWRFARIVFIVIVCVLL